MHFRSRPPAVSGGFKEFRLELISFVSASSAPTAAVLIDAHNLGTPPRSINLFDYRRFETLSERAILQAAGETKQGTPFPPFHAR